MVSLTFDDALDQHLDHAIRLLDEVGLPGTFYAHISAPALTKRWQEWKRAASSGHELGNHSIFHPADERKSWVRPGNALDNYCLDRMRQELEVANQVLFALDGKQQRSFAYPCSNPILGRRGWAKRALFRLGFERTRLPSWVDRCHLDFGSTQASFVPVVQELFLAGRGGGLTKGSTIPPVSQFARFQLPSVAIENWSLAELIAFTEKGLKANTWVILQFHGIGGGHRMDCGLDVFQQFTRWLAEHCATQVMTVAARAAQLWPEEPR